MLKRTEAGPRAGIRPRREPFREHAVERGDETGYVRIPPEALQRRRDRRPGIGHRADRNRSAAAERRIRQRLNDTALAYATRGCFMLALASNSNWSIRLSTVPIAEAPQLSLQ